MLLISTHVNRLYFVVVVTGEEIWWAIFLLYNVYSVTNKRKPRFNHKSLKVEKKNYEIVISGW